MANRPFLIVLIALAFALGADPKWTTGGVTAIEHLPARAARTAATDYTIKTETMTYVVEDAAVPGGVAPKDFLTVGAAVQVSVDGAKNMLIKMATSQKWLAIVKAYNGNP